MRIYIIQSLEQSKITIISALKILSSRKLDSQKILVDQHKVLVPAQKVETRTYFLYQEIKYQVDKILRIKIKYAIITHEKTTPIT